MTDKEAINHIEYGIIKGNYPLPKELGIEALNMALDAIKFKQKTGVVIEQLRADRDRLATALEEIEKEISELPNQNPSYWHKCDVLEREDVLEIIRKHRKDGKDEMPKM